MVHTEADMIVNQLLFHHINYHHINLHHQPPPHQPRLRQPPPRQQPSHPQLSRRPQRRHPIDDSTEEDDFIDKYANNGKKGKFSNSIRDKGRGYSNPDEFRVPSFDGSLDIESSLI